MKPLRFLILSAALNLVLAGAFVVLWPKSPAPAMAAFSAAAAPETSIATTNTSPMECAAPVATDSPFHWRKIESEDYRQYIANLRAVDCPERTIRDIIVSDIDQLYASKNKSAPFDPPPWLNADHRRSEDRARAERQSALRTEKRALVKELIGYEWDNHANEVWHEDFMTGLVLGFLPDAKAPQLMSIVGKYLDLAASARERVNDILIDEDHAQLRRLHAGLMAEASQLLGPADLEEIQLRVQAGTFLPAADIHWDQFTITGGELREYVRLSKSFKDMFRNEYFDPETLSGREQADRKAAFEKQLERLFGPKRLAEYQRAQDQRFREVFEFTRERSLPAATAVKIFDARSSAEQQAGELKHDKSLSSEEQALALAALKAVAVGKISSALGDTYRDYPDGPAGSWLQELSPSEAKEQDQSP